MAKKGLWGTKKLISVILIALVVILAAVIIYAFRSQITGSALTMPTPTPNVCNNLYFDPNTQLTRSDLADAVARAANGTGDYPVSCLRPSSPTFKDVSNTDSAYCYIEQLYRSGIITGCRADSTGKYFCPKDIATRATMAVFVTRWKAGGDANIPTPTTTSYKDVSKNYWAYKYIEYAKAKGLMGGYGDGTFRPDAAADRASIAVLLARANNRYKIPLTPTFKDVLANFWAFKEIEGVYGAGYMDGYCRTVSLTLAPSAGTYNVGNIFKVNILLNTGGNETAGTDAIITYNPLELEVQDADASKAGIQISPGTLYPTYPGNVVDTTKGKISISGIINPGVMNGYTGNGVFATITFKVLKASSTMNPSSLVSFVFTPGATNESNVIGKSSYSDLLNEVVNGRYILLIPSPIPSYTLYPSPSVSPTRLSSPSPTR